MGLFFMPHPVDIHEPAKMSKFPQKLDLEKPKIS